MMFLRRKLFLPLVGSLTSFLWVCYVVKNERETALSRRRVMEMTSVETNLSKGNDEAPFLYPPEDLFKLYDGVETFVMFIGYPRSSHSLVGALLDAHPHKTFYF